MTWSSPAGFSATPLPVPPRAAAPRPRAEQSCPGTGTTLNGRWTRSAPRQGSGRSWRSSRATTPITSAGLFSHGNGLHGSVIRKRDDRATDMSAQSDRRRRIDSRNRHAGDNSMYNEYRLCQIVCYDFIHGLPLANLYTAVVVQRFPYPGDGNGAAFTDQEGPAST